MIITRWNVRWIYIVFITKKNIYLKFIIIVIVSCLCFVYYKLLPSLNQRFKETTEDANRCGDMQSGKKICNCSYCKKINCTKCDEYLFVWFLQFIYLKIFRNLLASFDIIPKVTIPTAIVVFLESLLLLFFFLFSHDFRLHRRSYLMGVLYKVIWPQTESTFHRIFSVPTNVDFWSDGRLDFIAIFLIIIINLKERENTLP